MFLSYTLFVVYDLFALRMNSCLTDTFFQELAPTYAMKSIYLGCYATILLSDTISANYYRIFPSPIASPS